MENVRRRILYVDAYDSFANNIVSLLRLSLDVDVEIVTHDEYKDIDTFRQCLRHFDAVVVGPGPGDPRKEEDVGIIRYLWSLPEVELLPVFGICLGFQDLCRAFGGEVKKLHMPRHGIVSQVTPLDLDIFKGFQKFEATNYHSLHVDIGQASDPGLPDLAQAGRLCPSIQPLAWDTGDENNGIVLLAGRHISKPFWGVQYHPESICTSEEGSRIVSAWWKAATSWLSNSKRSVLRSPFPRLRRQLQEIQSKCASGDLAVKHVRLLEDSKLLAIGHTVKYRSLHRHVPDVNQICKDLRLSTPEKDEAIVLRSGKQKDGSLFGQGLGRFSIVGVISQESLHVQYDVQNKCVNIHRRSNSDGIPSGEPVKDVFAYIKQFMSLLQIDEGPISTPFWGGLMGYISYEAGLSTINVLSERSMTSDSANGLERPDVNFALVTRSIIVDHVEDKIYVQSIQQEDDLWLDEMLGKLDSITQPKINGLANVTINGHDKPPFNRPLSIVSSAVTPEKMSYIKKIMKCSTSIRAGDSYELCLTAQTRVHSPSTQSPFESGWSLYQRLSTTNPAPFSSFVRLHSSSDAVTIISSSPERFLSWSRSGQCQFRPIKGTVKKGPGVTYKDAQKILESSKERAENLMITDLIRHDLHGVAKLGTVHVPKLMQIEEYATVYQLVSVIEGDVSRSSMPSSSAANGTTNGTTNGAHKSVPTAGIDLLAASLPPGSMTGAPKRRSCELISQYEEQHPRGIYSGVLGYLDVGGGADFAVVIRTAIRWDKDGDGDVWKVGAGGAITAQSDTEDEFAEMVTKLDSTLGAFGLKGNGTPL